MRSGHRLRFSLFSHSRQGPCRPAASRLQCSRVQSWPDIAGPTCAGAPAEPCHLRVPRWRHPGVSFNGIPLDDLDLHVVTPRSWTVSLPCALNHWTCSLGLALHPRLRHGAENGGGPLHSGRGTHEAACVAAERSNLTAARPTELS